MSKPINKKTADLRSVAPPKDRFQALVAATSDIVYSLTADWQVMRELDGRGFLKDANEPTSEWFNINIPPDEQQRVRAHIDDAIREKKIFELEHRVLRADRTQGWTFSRAVPILDDDGEIIEWFGTATDITARKQIEQDLLIAKERAEEQTSLMERLNMDLAELHERVIIAVDAGGLGYTEVDLASGRMACNAAFKACYGRQPDELFNYPELFESMLPQYREDVKQRVAVAKANNSLYQAEYEVMWPDGTIHWISAHGRARYDRHGNADRMVGIVADITERKQDEQRKNDFIGMVSHELKTPLTSLNAYIQLLEARAKKTGDDFEVNALGQARKQAAKMTTMINGFLNVSRLESGKLSIIKQRFGIAALLSEAEAEVLPVYPSHQIIFKPVEETFVYADRDKIGQVISNLINNAVKYAKPGTPITVNCTVQNSVAIISVADEGIGIKAEEVPRLFERYYRAESNNNIAGFGIGLYLSAEIMARHQGKIWVDSEPGKGSTFYFSLPVVDLMQISV